MNLKFNDKECKVLNFTDISTYKRLKKEKETNRLLTTLNASVQHELLAPLKGNIELSRRLEKELKNNNHKQMAQTILLTTQMMMLHANDLLD